MYVSSAVTRSNANVGKGILQLWRVGLGIPRCCLLEAFPREFRHGLLPHLTRLSRVIILPMHTRHR
jgi:hypothetical protein